MPSNQQREPKGRAKKTEVEAPEAQPKTEKVASRADLLINPRAPYSKEWKDRWLTAAADAKDMADACSKARTTISEYLVVRTADREFDAACLVFDQIVELRIIDTVRRQAQEGMAPAQGVYFKSARRRSFGPNFASWIAEPSDPPPTTPMPSRVADAMIKAGLDEFEKMNRPSELNQKPSDDPLQLPKPDAEKR